MHKREIEDECPYCMEELSLAERESILRSRCAEGVDIEVLE